MLAKQLKRLNECENHSGVKCVPIEMEIPRGEWDWKIFEKIKQTFPNDFNRFRSVKLGLNYYYSIVKRFSIVLSKIKRITNVYQSIDFIFIRETFRKL